MFRLITLLLLLMIFATAQAQTPLTPENAPQLTFSRHIGGVVPKSLSWSPDGTKLAVGTSYETRVYDREALDKPLGVFPSSVNAHFGAFSDQIVINQQAVDLRTGRPLFNASMPKVGSSASGRFTLTKDPNQSGNLILTDTTGANPERTLEIASEGDISPPVFSPDETLVVIGVLDNTDPYAPVEQPSISPEVWLWSTETGEKVAQISVYRSLFFADFSEDGQQLMIAAKDFQYDTNFAEILLYDVTNLTVQTQYAASIYNSTPEFLAFDQNHVLFIWVHNQLHELGEVHFDENGGYSPVIFNPNRQLVVVEGTQQRYEVWSLQPQIELEFPISPDRVPRFSPDGRFLAAETGDNQLTVWSIDEHLSLEEAFIINNASGNFEFSPDGSLLIVGNGVWNTTQGEQIAVVETDLQVSRFSANGQWVVFSTSLYATPPRTEIYGVPSSDLLLSVSSTLNFSPDGLFAAYWEDATAKVVDFTTGDITSVFTVNNPVNEVKTWSVAANRVVIRRGNELLFYDLITGEIVANWIPDIMPTTITFSENGSLFNSFYASATSMIGFSATSDPTNELYRGTSQATQANTLSPDGSWYVTASANERRDGIYLKVMDTQTGEVLADIQSPSTLGNVTDIVFSHDQQTLILGGSSAIETYPMAEVLQGEIKNPQTIDQNQGDATIVLSPSERYMGVSRQIHMFMESELGVYLIKDQTTVLPVSTEGWFLTFSPDERLFLLHLSLWDTQTQEFILHLPGYHATFSPDSTLVAAGDSSTISLFSIATLRTGDRTPLITLPLMYTPIRNLDFSSDGTRLYVQDEGGVSVWETSG